MTGLFVFAYFKAAIILPGYAPTYVLLWPFKAEESLTPPNEISINFLPNALAIDLAKVVLPTPGGPTKHKTFPLRDPFNLPTAINYNIFFLASFMP